MNRKFRNRKRRLGRTLLAVGAAVMVMCNTLFAAVSEEETVWGYKYLYTLGISENTAVATTVYYGKEYDRRVYTYVTAVEFKTSNPTVTQVLNSSNSEEYEAGELPTGVTAAVGRSTGYSIKSAKSTHVLLFNSSYQAVRYLSEEI